jgi:hypothetical protein
MFGRDPKLFAQDPLDGWRDDQDAPSLPWDRLHPDLLGESPEAEAS